MSQRVVLPPLENPGSPSKVQQEKVLGAAGDASRSGDLKDSEHQPSHIEMSSMKMQGEQAPELQTLNMPNHNSRAYDGEERKDIADVEKAANDPEAKAEQEEEISYARLKNYIIDNHPTNKETDQFGLCDYVGNNPWLCCCRDARISEMSQEIGVGPTMFLMSAKSLAILFFVLTIINIPCYVFYYGSSADSASIKSPQDLFNALSLGNIGQAAHACDVINWAQDATVSLSCNVGTLTSIRYMGVTKTDDQTCTSLLNAKSIDDSLVPDCYTDFEESGAEIHSALGHPKFEATYKTDCLGKTSCKIPMVLAELKPKCQKLIDSRTYTSKYATTAATTAIKTAYPSVTAAPKLPEPWFIAIASCQTETVSINVREGGKTWTVNKSDFGICVVLIDFLCVTIFIYFIYFLDTRQKEYYKKYEDQTITMADFTMEFKSIPRDGFFNGREQVLRAILFKQMEEVMAEQYELQAGKELASESQEIQDRYSIVDIQFAKTDINDSILLESLNAVRLDKELIGKRLKSADSDKEKDKIEKDLAKVEQKYKQMAAEYFEKYNQSAVADDGCGKCDTDKVADPNNESIIRAYISFRSMDGLQVIQDTYNYTTCGRKCIELCRCFNRRRHDLIKKRYVGGNWPEPTLAQLPDQIQWQNMGYSPESRCMRMAFVYFISLLIIIASMLGILYFKSLSKISLDTKYVVPTFCPPKVTQLQAFNDHEIANPLNRRGLMSCYCLKEMKVLKDPKKVFAISFDSIKGAGKTPYCKEWFYVYAQDMALKFGAPMVIIAINVIVPIVFHLLSEFEHATTKTEETERTFKKVAVLSYFNIAIVILMINMNVGLDFSDGFPILNGDYADFNTKWYKNVGAALSFTLLVNVFTPQMSKLSLPLIKVALRCLDRGCGRALKKDEDGVHTKKVLQTDLENLYTGAEISAFYVYAQYFVAMWSVMSYSGGMPCLYPIGCLNFFVLYWVYKYLLLKMYCKTTSFDQQLCISSMALFKYAVIFHLFFGAFFFSNSNILSANNIKYLQFVKVQLAAATSFKALEKDPVFARFSDGIGLLYFLFILFLIALFIFEGIVVNLLAKLAELAVYCCQRGWREDVQLEKEEAAEEKEEEDEDAGLEVVSDDMVKDFSLAALDKFYDRVQREYEDFQQIDVSQFPDAKVKSYCEDKMKKRIAYVNATILHHVKVLLFEVGTANEAALMALPPNEQLEVLLMNVQTILDSSKLTNALRMKGINQSYSMFDAKMFDDAQIMKAVLIEEQQEKKLDINNEGGGKASGTQQSSYINIVAPIDAAYNSRDGSALEKENE